VVRQAADALRAIGVERPDRAVGGVVRAAIEEELIAAAGADPELHLDPGVDPGPDPEQDPGTGQPE
jgi:hypothetical protein